MKILKYTLFTIGLMLLFKTNVYALNTSNGFVKITDPWSPLTLEWTIDGGNKIKYVIEETGDTQKPCHVYFEYNNILINEVRTSACRRGTMVAYSENYVYTFQTSANPNTIFFSIYGNVEMKNYSYLKVNQISGNTVNILEKNGLDNLYGYICQYNRTTGQNNCNGYIHSKDITDLPVNILYANTTIARRTSTSDNGQYTDYWDFREPSPLPPEPEPVNPYPELTDWYNTIIQEITKTITFIVNETILTATIGILFIIFIIEILKKLLK